jgi:hypothetical protein
MEQPANFDSIQAAENNQRYRLEDPLSPDVLFLGHFFFGRSHLPSLPSLNLKTRLKRLKELLGEVV